MSLVEAQRGLGFRVTGPDPLGTQHGPHAKRILGFLGEDLGSPGFACES